MICCWRHWSFDETGNHMILLECRKLRHYILGLKKKLAALSLLKNHRELACWIKSISNHLYWTVDTTEANTELRRGKWLSLLDHISDVHVFDNNNVFPACQHEPYGDNDDNTDSIPSRQWILKGN